MSTPEKIVKMRPKARTAASDILSEPDEPIDDPNTSAPAITAREFARTNDLDDETNQRLMFRLMNAECAAVRVGSNILYAHKQKVIKTVMIGGHALHVPKLEVTLHKKADFLARFENASFLTMEGGREKRISFGAAWMKRKHRTEYERVQFFPGGTTPKNVLNTWQGWNVAPRPGDWSILREHIRDNICNGRGGEYEWLLDWMADIFQNPHRKPGTAPTLKGLKGTGKTKLSEWLGYIVGDAIVLDKPEHLIGQFTGHLSDKLLITADEATWGGSKNNVGALNTLITSPTLTCERKGVDATETMSFHRVIIIGNSDWLVPATADERRFAVFEVGNGRRQDRAYFAALDDQMAAGGAEAMLHDLLHRTITHDVGSAPRTVALTQQIAQGLRPIERMLVRLASEGALYDSRGERILEIDERETAVIDKAVFMNAVGDAYRGRYPPREVGETLKAIGVTESRPRSGGNRCRLLFFPAASALEISLESHFGATLGTLAGFDSSGATR